MKAQQIKSYFENHPSVNEFHFTSCGAAFFNNEGAWGNAQNLEDKKITAITRDQANALADEDEVDLTTPKVEVAPVADFTEGGKTAGANIGKTAEAGTGKTAEVVGKYFGIVKKDLLAMIAERKLKLGAAKANPELIAILEADDANKAKPVTGAEGAEGAGEEGAEGPGE